MNVLDNFLSWLIFGSVIGGLAYILSPEKFRGKAPILLGISGAILTGFLASLVLNIPLHKFSLVSLFVALCGSCFFVVGNRTLRNV